EGFVKILADAQGKVLGCQILGLHASDLIHEVTLLMSLGGTTEQLANTIHAHPTLSEVVMKAVEK
ncbi:MAG: dihydrolipoyl dehydrogenase, partial [Bacteroidaceae bacterium]|nr:dihydrolipoyl dehydrogenase [Bacteroidaceae bacterium]